MPPKEKPTNVNTNNNVNNNVNNFTINLPPQENIADKKKSEPNWYRRTIIGGIITLVLSVSGYYVKKKIDLKNSVSPAVIQSNVPAVVETTSNNK